MMDMSIFEIGMLLCFASAWPTNIYNSLKTKNVENKNIVFLYIIGSGYIFGMLHKVYYSWDYVFILYLVNFIMILIDYVLYRKYKIKEV